MVLQVYDILRQYSMVLKADDPELLNEFLILKASPKKLIAMQNRLNKKLNRVGDKLINRVIADFTYDGKDLRPDITAAFVATVPATYIYGANTILNKVPHTNFEKNLIKEDKLQKIFDDRIFSASETTMNNLTGEVLPKIKEGITEGRAYNKTATELKPEFKNMTDWQMKRIARTETHSVYNQSKLETMQKARSVQGKQWISSGLPNMREWHADVDGQTVAVGEPFIVDGEELMFPGDPDGSAENVINCACTMVPVLRM